MSHDLLEMAAEDPSRYLNPSSLVIGVATGFLVNSLGKEYLDRRDKTDNFGSYERFLAGVAFSGAQYGVYRVFEGPETETLSWFEVGYVLGGGATYSLPERDELNEYVDTLYSGD